MAEVVRRKCKGARGCLPNCHVPPSKAYTHLLCPLGLGMVIQKGALKDRAHNGQALPCLELGGQREQLWMDHVLVLVHTYQHQQLRPEAGARSRDPSTTSPSTVTHTPMLHTLTACPPYSHPTKHPSTHVLRLSTHPVISHTSLHPPTHLSLHPSHSPMHSSIHPPTHPSIYPPTHPSILSFSYPFTSMLIYQHMHYSFNYPHTHLPPSIHTFIYSPNHTPIHIFTQLSTHLFICSFPYSFSLPSQP